jgi:hypothetical protein
LPTGQPRVRLIGASVSAVAPPPEFGPLAAPPAEVVSTFGLLVEAARELGKLGELAAEVRPRADQKVENAQQLLWLIQIAQGQQAAVKTQLQGMTPALDWPDYLVVRACLEDRQLADVGETFVQQFLPAAKSNARSHRDFLSQLRSDLAASRVARSAAGQDLKRRLPRLAHWHQTERTRGHAYQTGAGPTWWVAADGRVSHLTGIAQEYLFYDYPLAGTFSFSIDAYESPYYESHVSYGGLIYENAYVGFSGPQILAVNLHDIVGPMTSSLVRDEFNRLTLEVEPGKVRYLVNDRLWFEDADAGPASPWLALFSRRESQAVFRNPTLRGTPTIPRTLSLSHEDRLDGWVCTTYFETMPRRLDPNYRAKPQGEYDWTARDGVIRGRRALALVSDPEIFIGSSFLQALQVCLRPLAPQPVPSHLAYLRPLRPGETLSYEFYYKPGEVLAHPSVGRVAFLLEPDGIRLHWLTEGLDKDWTGLAVDNAVAVPTERRGPAKLPLNADAWNSLQVKVTDAGVMLELNGAVVYERKLATDADRTFGLFHYKDQTAVQVRNVVLTGKWPEKITPQEMADSFFPVEKKDGALRRALIGEEFFR